MALGPQRGPRRQATSGAGATLGAVMGGQVVGAAGAAIPPHPDAYQTWAVRPREIAQVYGTLPAIQRQLRARGANHAASVVARAIFRFDADMQKIETDFPPLVDKVIRQKLQSRIRRPAKGNTTPLAGVIVSRPFRTRPAMGGVLVALLDELDKVSYWKGIEDGVPTRFLQAQRGGFLQSGWQPPFVSPHPRFIRQTNYGGGTHPIFVPTGRGRMMTPKRPIVAKHFLRDGMDQVAKNYLAAVTAAGARLARELAKV